MFAVLDSRPIVVALAGPNGAGKTTFYNAHLEACGLRFLSADSLSQELNMNAYAAAQAVGTLRQELLERRESFVFETVFSDPVQDKLTFLKRAEQAGYTVVLCFIGLANSRSSAARVAMRVSQGGHNVPLDKMVSRFPRTQANLKAAIRVLQHVFVFDNEDLRKPFRHVAAFEKGRLVFLNEPVPQWLQPMLPSKLS